MCDPAARAQTSGMTSKPATPLKSNRVGGALAAALCALALTACGTEGAVRAAPAGAGAVQVANPAPTRTATPAPAATPTAPRPDPADDSDVTPETQAAELRFMGFLLTLAEPCMGGLPAEPPTAEPDSPPPASPQGPPKPAPAPSEVPVEAPAPPSEKPWDFEHARQEMELSEPEKCAAPLHGNRIAQALDGTGDPTPAHVKKVLNGLGYDVDYRLHGPRKTNGKVEFTIDLRSMGSQLCLSGGYDGTRTTFDPYGASPEVYCTDVKRRP